MTGRSPETSPQTFARVGGMLYLFIIVAALFGEGFVRDSLIVPHDPAATANNILGSEMLFRLGLAGEMLTCVCDVALAMILYFLLRPVSSTYLFPWAMLPAFPAELGLGLWLAVKGVNVPKWKERAHG